ncbi:MAG: ABC transporter substrate-binding protein [Chloroflexi bacterium]|nr:ABC transporter substrate-binding protein [Chloroflexota bacterium]
MIAKKKWTTMFALLVVASIVLSACATPTPEIVREVVTQVVEVEKEVTRIVKVEEVVTATPGPAVGIPRRGGTLRIGLMDEPDNLDPHYLLSTASMRVMEVMYSTLVRLDENMDFEPDLATAWEASEDGTTYTFHLRRGVKFWCNGREMVADDVKYSIERLSDPDGGSPWNYAWGDLDRIEVIDDYTIRVVMSKPSAQTVAQIATSWTAIVPKEFVEEHDGSLKTAACGTGPFKLVEWIPYQHIKLARNEDYYDPELPYLDELIWIPIQDETTRSQQVLAGELDVDLQVSPKFLSSYETASNIKLVSGPVCSYSYLSLNAAREPFDDQRVRQAVAWAIDREEIIEVIAFGQGTPLKGGLIGPETHWAYADIVVYPEPDLDKARQLLAEAGYPDGLEVECLSVGGTVHEDICTIVKDQLAEVGIDVQISAMESGAVSQKFWTEHDFDFRATRWGTWIDPDDFVYGEFHTKGGWNPGSCGYEELDKLLDEARAVVDREERKLLYKEIDRLIAEDACYVLLYREIRNAGVQNYVMGFKHEAGNTQLSIRDTWLAEH